MTWNYRVVRNKDYLQIYEVYYYGDNPTSITMNAITIGGETIESLAKNLSYAQEALTKPILEYSNFINMGKEPI